MRLLNLIVGIGFISLITSCDLVPRYGCESESATNFDASASRDDGSCIYMSTGILYWDYQVNNFFENNNVTHIDIKLGEDLVLDNADIAQYDYWDFPQSCSGTDWPFFSTSVKQNNHSPKHLQVFDQNDSLIISDVLSMSTGCGVYEIEAF